MTTEQKAEKLSWKMIAIYAALSFFGSQYAVHFYTDQLDEKRVNDQIALRHAVLVGYCQEKGYVSAGGVAIGVRDGDIHGTCIDATGDFHDFVWPGAAKETLN